MGVCSPGGAPPHCQGRQEHLSPVGESSGCPQMVLQDTVGHRTLGWCRVAQTGLAGSSCWSLCVPYSQRHSVLRQGLCHAEV